MVTVIVLVAALVVPGTTLFGENVTIDSAGSPAADRLTSCVNGLLGSVEPSRIVKLTGFPRAAACEAGWAASVKSAATAASPVPVSDELCVPKLSTTVKEADSLPAVVG